LINFSKKTSNYVCDTLFPQYISSGSKTVWFIIHFVLFVVLFTLRLNGIMKYSSTNQTLQIFDRLYLPHESFHWKPGNEMDPFNLYGRNCFVRSYLLCFHYINLNEVRILLHKEKKVKTNSWLHTPFSSHRLSWRHELNYRKSFLICTNSLSYFANLYFVKCSFQRIILSREW
jgi:hypothetical protein